MEGILKVFDECIEDLIVEIKEVEEGLHDHRLEFIASYPIKLEYLTKIGMYCHFPLPPSFPLESPVKGNLKLDEAVFASAVVPERRPTRVIKKRKFDGDDDDGGDDYSPAEKIPVAAVVDTTPPAPKPPGRRPGRPRLVDRVQPSTPS